jgi:hypothetical protein
MPKVFAKLNLKDQSQIVVINAPQSFEPELASLRNVQILRDTRAANEISFALVFVTKQKEIREHAMAIGKKTAPDAIVWFAYPKKTSRNYKSDIDRDHSWQPLGDLGFEGVRMVAIDEDWSAVRFRRAEFIKTLTRDKAWAMSKAGKAKTRKRPTKA